MQLGNRPIACCHEASPQRMTIDPLLLPAIELSRSAWPVPGDQLPLGVWRERYESLVAAARPKQPVGVTSVDRVVGERKVAVRIYRPAAKGALTGLVYFHGGGWVIGSVRSHDDITTAIAHDAGCVVISVEYSRAPEHPFPTAFDEGVDVVEWLRAHGTEIDVDPRRLLVGGDSAGGNLAAAIALEAVERDAALAGQLLLYPCVDTDFTRPSDVNGGDAPFLTSQQMQWFWDQYAPSSAVRTNPFAVPMRSNDVHLCRVAPAFVATAEHDPLRDEGAAYATRLGALGVDLQYEPGAGMVHGFVRLRHTAAEPARIFNAMCDWIRYRSTR